MEPALPHPFLRGKITGADTFLGILHTLPFLIPAYRATLTSHQR